jgi:ATP-dependent Clp protease adaptor protein ClpS
VKKKKYQLILLDDDVNSFDDVMNGLCEVLGHNTYQAEQCAMIVHHKGECVITHGTKDDINFYKKVLTELGLKLKINKIEEKT